MGGRLAGGLRSFEELWRAGRAAAGGLAGARLSRGRFVALGCSFYCRQAGGPRQGAGAAQLLHGVVCVNIHVCEARRKQMGGGGAEGYAAEREETLREALNYETLPGKRRC